MKFGMRKPSLNKRIAARTSVSRYVRHSLGLKAPRGMGWITNPKKAAYNRVYNRTSFSIDKLFGGGKSSGDAIVLILVFGVIILACYVVYQLVMATINLFRQSNVEQENGSDLNVVHLQNTNPICPNCSNYMVKRTARRGRSKGNFFWGCSSFPRCRGTRNA